MIHTRLREGEAAFECGFPFVWERIQHTIDGPTQVDETESRCSGYKGQAPPTGPTFLALPVDVMNSQTDDRPERLGSIPAAGGGNSEDVRRAVDAVADVSSVGFVVGDNLGFARSDASRAAVRFAEVSGACVYGEKLTLSINFPTDHPSGWAPCRRRKPSPPRHSMSSFRPAAPPTRRSPSRTAC